MDQTRFDLFARELSTYGSRRAFIRFLAGSGVASALSRLGLTEALAGCVAANKKCGGGASCCRGARCQHGRCRCKTGLSACAVRCRDFQTDESHCGSCNQSCQEGESCQAGVCGGPACVADGQSCTDTTDCCGGACMEGVCCSVRGNTAATCGACCSGRCAIEGAYCACRNGGEQCQFDVQCCSGACSRGTCGCPGLGAGCNGDSECCGGRCDETTSTCTACPLVSCAPGEPYDFYTCQCGCPPERPFNCPGGSCVNLQTDRYNCGTCGFECLPAEVCRSGQCGT